MNNPHDLNEITLITVTYNSSRQAEFFKKTADLFNSVVVVDNGSADSTYEIFKQKIPHAEVVGLQKNIGFGPGNNVGFLMAKTEFVLFMNPDCSIALEDIKMLKSTFATYPSAVMVGPRMQDENGKTHYSYKWDFRWPLNNPEYIETDGPVSARHIHGSCFMVRSEAFKKMGMFSNDFFMYFEEDDLALRAIARGYDVISIPNASCTHQGGQSSLPSARVSWIKTYHMTRSRLILLQKYVNPWKSHWIATKQLVKFPFSFVIYSILFRPKYIWKQAARAAASFDYLMGTNFLSASN